MVSYKEIPMYAWNSTGKLLRNLQCRNQRCLLYFSVMKNIKVALFPFKIFKSSQQHYLPKIQKKKLMMEGVEKTDCIS